MTNCSFVLSNLHLQTCLLLLVHEVHQDSPRELLSVDQSVCQHGPAAVVNSHGLSNRYSSHELLGLEHQITLQNRDIEKKIKTRISPKPISKLGGMRTCIKKFHCSTQVHYCVCILNYAWPGTIPYPMFELQGKVTTTYVVFLIQYHVLHHI